MGTTAAKFSIGFAKFVASFSSSPVLALLALANKLEILGPEKTESNRLKSVCVVKNFLF